MEDAPINFEKPSYSYGREINHMSYTKNKISKEETYHNQNHEIFEEKKKEKGIHKKIIEFFSNAFSTSTSKTSKKDEELLDRI